MTTIDHNAPSVAVRACANYPRKSFFEALRERAQFDQCVHTLHSARCDVRGYEVFDLDVECIMLEELQA